MLSQTVDMCIRSISDVEFKQALKVDISIPSNSAALIVDSSSLERAFINIIDNALYALGKKYHRSHPGTQFTPILAVRLAHEEDFLVIKISDNGPGIPVHQQGKVFDEFYTTKPAGEGTGLGLSIARQIIEKNNGDIQLQSTEGQGTEVTIGIPYSAPPMEASL